jgi:hypothetical protein
LFFIKALTSSFEFSLYHFLNMSHHLLIPSKARRAFINLIILFIYLCLLIWRKFDHLPYTSAKISLILINYFQLFPFH